MVIWGALLRARDGEIFVSGVVSLSELHKHSMYFTLRQRYQIEERIIVHRYPPGTTAEQVTQAIELLTREERLKLWNLPVKAIGASR